MPVPILVQLVKGTSLLLVLLLVLILVLLAHLGAEGASLHLSRLLSLASQHIMSPLPAHIALVDTGWRSFDLTLVEVWLLHIC